MSSGRGSSSAGSIGAALAHMATVLAEGDSRPGREPGDWLDGRIPTADQLAAIRRHIARYEGGERADADSGAHPLAHVMARCAMLITLDTMAAELSAMDEAFRRSCLVDLEEAEVAVAEARAFLEEDPCE